MVGPGLPSRPLRVLHVRSSAGLYGAERVVLNHCRQLVAGGQAAGLCILRSHTSQAAGFEQEARGITGLAVSVVVSAGPADFGAYRRLKEAIRNFSPDVVHTHDYKSTTLVAWMSSGSSWASVATVHGWTLRTWRVRWYTWLERLALRRFDGVVGVDRLTLSSLEQSGVRKERLYHVPNAIDLTRFQRSGGTLRPERGILAVIGRLSVEKGVDQFLRAIGILRDRGIRVRGLVAGDGPERPGLEALRQELGLQTQVEFLGVVADVPKLLLSIDGLVLPSHREGMPMVLLEAMAAGVPVVATDVGAVREVLGEDGYITPPGGIAELADAMQQVVQGGVSELRIESARHRVRLAFASEVQAEAMLRVYADVAS